MKRAEVWKCRWCGRWAVTSGTRLLAEKHTYQKALSYALAEVGLTLSNPEKETPVEHNDQQCSNPETLCGDCLHYGAQDGA